MGPSPVVQRLALALAGHHAVALLEGHGETLVRYVHQLTPVRTNLMFVCFVG